MMKLKKLHFFGLIILVLFLLNYLIRPVFARDVNLDKLSEQVRLSKSDEKAFLRALPNILTDEWIELASSASGYEKQAVVMLLRKAVRADMRDYMLVEGPKDLAIEFLKISYQMGKLALTSDMSVLLKEIEKMTVKESLKYLGQWLEEKDVKISMGDLVFNYESYERDNDSHRFQYLIFYYPESVETGRGVIKIYSSTATNPPISRGSLGAMTGTGWLAKDEEIQPFILTIEGKMRKKQIGWWKSKFMHQYYWDGQPDISIVFSEDVPYFDFKEKGFFEKIGAKVKDFFNSISNWFSPASVVEPPEIKLEETHTDSGFLAQIKGLLESIVEQLKLLAGKLSEAQQRELKKTIEEAEKERDLESLAEKLKKLENQLDKMLKDVEDLEGKDTEDLEEEEIATTTESKKALNESEHIVINEVCAGFDKAENEFIELYNPTDSEINLEDYLELYLVNSSNQETKKQLDLHRTTMPAKGYFILIGGELGNLSPDANYSSQLTSVSGAIIKDKQGNVLDKVSWGTADKLAPERAVENQGKTLENGLLTGLGLGRVDFIDSNNNSLDFKLLDPPTPLNSLGDTFILEKDNEKNDDEDYKQGEEEEEEEEEEQKATSGGGGGSAGSSVSYCSQNNLGEALYFPVIINEVAWMGTEESYADEWIELKNISTTTVNLNNWQLLDKDNQIKIVFGNEDLIGPNDFYILERTDDNTLPNLSADKIYTGNLGNFDESLRLFNKDCQLIDEVVASSSWPAGDNEAKKTMERNEDLSWHTYTGQDYGTPGQQNSPVINKETDNGQNDGQNDGQLSTTTNSATTTNSTTTASSTTTVSAATTVSSTTTASATTKALDHLLITEVRNFGSYEFVEIYNPTQKDIYLGDLWLSYFSKNRDYNNPFLNTPLATTTLSPGNYYLIGFGDFPAFGEQQPDFSPYQSNLSDTDGAIALFSNDPNVASTSLNAEFLKIDVLGWGGALVREGDSAINVEDKSLARKVGLTEDGRLQYIDTGDNLSDFEAQTSTPGSLNLHNYSDLDMDGIIDSYDATTTIMGTTTLAAGEYQFNNLEILGKGYLNLLSDSRLPDFKGVKIIADNLIVGPQAKISADKNGYQDKVDIEKDYSNPKTLGSAGEDATANSCCPERPAGDGGGAIILKVNYILDVEGTISANGEEGLAQGSYGCAATNGGDGGSIYIDTKALKGAGVIEANGGRTYAGITAGNGGQIAIYYQQNQFTGKISAYGGQGGHYIEDTGTVYFSSSSDKLIIKGNDNRNNCPLKHSLTGLDKLVFASTSLDLSSTIDIQVGSLLLKNSIFSNQPKQILNIFADDFQVFNSTIESNLNIEANSIVIGDSSKVSADGLGYQTDEGPGCGIFPHSGGSYAGIGGGNSTSSIYGSSTKPVEFGSGGKGNPENISCCARAGGAGGGKIFVQTTDFAIEGELTANGKDGLGKGSWGCAATGAGSGGNIYIIANNLVGNGLIQTNGGNASSVGRGGGGGRVAIYGNSAGFSGIIESLGGVNPEYTSYNGTNGSIYLSP